jgi:hypothetical protein
VPARKPFVFGDGLNQVYRAPPDLLERNMKNASNRSLRYQVEKWLAPASSSLVHVTNSVEHAGARTRYVCVETSSSAGVRVLFFFRHDDGTWHVFPPAVDIQKSTSEHIAA